MRIVTFKGSPMTLVGRPLVEGRRMPDFIAVTGDMKDVRLSDFKNKVKVISSFPSLDTPVCDLQVKEFNKRAHGLSDDIVVIGISKDLPFAQQRFCQINEIKKEVVLSDYKYSSFGLCCGMFIKELNLLARGVLIVDKNDTLRYMSIVKELTSPPDYNSAFKELERITSSNISNTPPDESHKCKPCQAGATPMRADEAIKLLAGIDGWKLVEGKKITKEFRFKGFADSKYFVDAVSAVAEEEGHHPTTCLGYNRVTITLTTHAAGGLTDNDFIMAQLIEGIFA